jgi:hypothetical protein
MKTSIKLLLTLALTLLTSATSFSQQPGECTTPCPKFKILGTFPALRITFKESLKDSVLKTRPHINMLDAGGIGLSYGVIATKSQRDSTDIYFDFSVNLFLLLSVREGGILSNLAPTFGIGGFNNTIQLGFGYDFGDLPRGTKQGFLVLSLSKEFAKF